MSILANAEETRWSLARLLSWTSEYFQRQQLDDARLAAEVLLAHVAGCRRIDLYTRFDDVLDDARVKHYRELVRRAAQGEPVAYRVGEKEFFSLAFRVTPDVLIPRGEAERVGECAVAHCRRASLHKHLRLCSVTGTGCATGLRSTGINCANCRTSRGRSTSVAGGSVWAARRRICSSFRS